MFLEQKSTGNLIEIVKTEDLSDPSCSEVEGRSHAGEEMQDMEAFEKEDLKFPSGESLPTCWLDPNYRAAAPKVSS
ncbi:hypothetical protein [Oscillatoria acuminata]|uniref:Acetyltransferase n=1 Tax=Oscillatoria acuminata PCC 6304 TaxID=56110 RepID=K9TQ52_9CYAN|nr:hypothetical protein [Oscillatoria acuminata]AFY84977.1 hypothetical protein Oscil6304_5493 [Oscillatoria acuminata PCC 6304]